MILCTGLYSHSKEYELDKIMNKEWPDRLEELISEELIPGY